MAEKKIRDAGRVEIPPAPEEAKKAPDKRSAIALRYDVDKDKAPVIIAAGKGSIAEEIIQLAEENGIPLYEDRGLAELLSKIELDTEIPPDLYILVAEVLFFVYRLERMAEKREKVVRKMKEEEKK